MAADLDFDPDGLAMCSLYAYPPNSLHYCGPEKQLNLKAYIREKITDLGLVEIIRRFETLYPYLQLIARCNNIKDPFDRRVVEAYWIGNKLLGNVARNRLFGHLKKEFNFKLTQKHQKNIQIYSEYGYPYHNFHVLNIFSRTEHVRQSHILSTIDSCRISWGTVLKKIDQNSYLTLRQPFIFSEEKIILGKPVEKICSAVGLDLNKSDFVSLHWDYVCQKITPSQKANLIKYTDYALKVYNMNLNS